MFFAQLLRQEFPALATHGLDPTAKAYPLLSVIRDSFFSRPATEAKEDIIRRITKISSSAPDTALGICPAGNWTKDIIPSADKMAKVTIFDSSPQKTTTTIKGRTVFPLHELPKHQIDHLFILSAPFGEEIYTQIHHLSPSLAQKTYTPFTVSYLQRERCRRSITKIAALVRRKPNRTLLLATEVCYPQHLQYINLLKEKGWQVILLTCGLKKAGLLPQKELTETFDLIINCKDNSLNFLYIIQHSHPSLIHLKPIIHSYILTALAALVAKVPVVCEFYDILSSAFDEQSYAQLVGVAQAQKQFLAEKILCCYSHALLYKSSPTAMNHFSQDVPLPSITQQILPPICDIGPSPQVKQPKATGHVSLVYAGGVHGKGFQATSSPFSPFSMIDILTKQGFSYTIFNVYHCEDGSFALYQQAALENDLFHYAPPIPRPQLLPTLAGFDCGWLYVDVEHSAMADRHFQTAVATKMFDYLSAHLPVIVSDHFAYMATLLAEWDVGCGISQQALPTLHKLLTKEKITHWRKNILRLKQDKAFTSVQTLHDFYDNAINTGSSSPATPSWSPPHNA